MRLTMTVVFPLPAPAKTNKGPSTEKTASFWGSFMRAKIFSITLCFNCCTVSCKRFTFHLAG